VQFYNVSNKWTVPDDPTNDTATSQPPYYVLAAPASSKTSDQSVFQLTSPMNVNSSTYLAAYMSVNNDAGADYGKITVLQLPRGTQAVQAPEQVYNKITSNSVITKDLTFFNSPNGGSTVTHGNLLTLPVGDSFLYIEPLYNRSSSLSQGTYPVLVRVIAVYGDRVGYGASLEDALSDFQPNHTTGQTLPGGTSGTPSTSPGTGSSASPSPPSSSSSPPSGGNNNNSVTLQQLTTANNDLQSALASGDQAKIFAAQIQLNKMIAKYLQQQSTSGPPSPTGKPQPSK
jgi:uncharacterized protein